MTPTIIIYTTARGRTSKGEFKVSTAERLAHGDGIKAAFDKEEMQSYTQALVILGDANPTLFFIY
jgi:hypothetical protein